jgi:hypothetical protein
MSKHGFPLGWDEARVKRLIDHYENMSDDEIIAEDEAGCERAAVMDLCDIHFHDSVVRRVVEVAETHDLFVEVLYPVDWENNVFEPRVIAFRDVLNYRIEEGPFVGSPTILDAYDEGPEGEWRRVTLQTNAGTRSLLFRSVELLTIDEAKRDYV